jgi:hypothetical protein
MPHICTSAPWTRAQTRGSVGAGGDIHIPSTVLAEGDDSSSWFKVYVELRL